LAIIPGETESRKCRSPRISKLWRSQAKGQRGKRKTAMGHSQKLKNQKRLHAMFAPHDCWLWHAGGRNVTKVRDKTAARTEWLPVDSPQQPPLRSQLMRTLLSSKKKTLVELQRGIGQPHKNQADCTAEGDKKAKTGAARGSPHLP